MKKSINLPSAIASVFLLAGMSQAMAQVAPTMQEKMACRSDAGRYAYHAPPDVLLRHYVVSNEILLGHIGCGAVPDQGCVSPIVQGEVAGRMLSAYAEAVADRAVKANFHACLTTSAS